MTRAEEQAERYRNTPCPGHISRRKLKAVGLSNYKIEEILKQYLRKLAAAEKRLSKTQPDKDNFTVFMEMLTSLGGEYQAFIPPSDSKQHTDGKWIQKSMGTFVKEMSEDDAHKVFEMLNGPKSDDVRKEFKGHYFRDGRGCLRRLFAS